MTSKLDDGSTKQVVRLATDIPNGHRMEVVLSDSGGGQTFSAPVEIDSTGVGTKELILKNFAAQTANAMEVQTSAGTPYVTIGPDVLAGDSATKNFLNITGTIPTVPSAITNGVNFSITGAGSASFAQRAAIITLNAGYTGGSSTAGINATNSSAGTGATLWAGTAFNSGGTYNCNGSTAGNNAGLAALVSGSSTLNISGRFVAVSATNTPALNVGLGALALNATVNVPGFFGLMSTAPTLAASAALIADTGAVAADGFKVRDNGTDVFQVTDGGPVIQTDIANTSAFKFQSFVSNGAEAGNIIRVAQTAAVVFTATSDEDLKNVVGDSDIDAAMDRVMAYKMKKYAFKSQPKLMFDGPLAQQAYSVSKDPMLVFPGNGKDAWKINMSGFIPDLIMAVQNLQSQVNELRAQ